MRRAAVQWVQVRVRVEEKTHPNKDCIKKKKKGSGMFKEKSKQLKKIKSKLDFLAATFIYIFVYVHYID